MNASTKKACIAKRLATVHSRPKLVASYFCREKRLCCSFVLYYFTQKKRSKTLCLIAFDESLMICIRQIRNKLVANVDYIKSLQISFLS